NLNLAGVAIACHCFLVTRQAARADCDVAWHDNVTVCGGDREDQGGERGGVRGGYIGMGWFLLSKMIAARSKLLLPDVQKINGWSRSRLLNDKIQLPRKETIHT
ncbi:unnamed protein product, partial [Ectocarpus sp. 4 AP-2014]